MASIEMMNKLAELEVRVAELEAKVLELQPTLTVGTFTPEPINTFNPAEPVRTTLKLPKKAPPSN